MIRTRALAAAIIAAGLGLALTACGALPSVRDSTGAASGTPSPTGAVTVQQLSFGGGGPTEHMEGCLPDSAGDHPVLVLVHGGSFDSGDYSDLDDLCRQAAAHGYAAFSVEYRRLPTTYPGQLRDLAADVEWVRTQRSRFRLDTDRMSLLGASAGAALVAQVLTDVPGSPLRSRDFTSGVLLSGAYGLGPRALPADLTATNLAYLGCRSYTDCRNAELASAARHATAADPPMLLVNATHELMPAAQARGFAAALARAGAPHRLLVVPGSDHAEFLVRKVPVVSTAVWNFLAQSGS